MLAAISLPPDGLALDAAIEEALAEMERRSAARGSFSGHLEGCAKCAETDALCAEGAALVRRALG